VWRAVDLELAKSNALSFGDLLVYAVRLLAEHPTGSHSSDQAPFRPGGGSAATFEAVAAAV
jgi:hypothetical protein